MKRKVNLKVIHNEKGENRMTISLASDIDKNKLKEVMKVFRVKKAKTSNYDSTEVSELFELACNFRKETNPTQDDIKKACKELRKELSECL